MSDNWQKRPIYIYKRDLYVWYLTSARQELAARHSCQVSWYKSDVYICANETCLYLQNRPICLIFGNCRARTCSTTLLPSLLVQKRRIYICKLDLFIYAKETYWTMQKRPIYMSKQDLFICAKETYLSDIWQLWGENLQTETFSKSVGTQESHQNRATWGWVHCCYPISDGGDKVRAILANGSVHKYSNM